MMKKVFNLRCTFRTVSVSKRTKKTRTQKNLHEYYYVYTKRNSRKSNFHFQEQQV